MKTILMQDAIKLVEDNTHFWVIESVKGEYFIGIGEYSKANKDDNFQSISGFDGHNSLSIGIKFFNREFRYWMEERFSHYTDEMYEEDYPELTEEKSC